MVNAMKSAGKIFAVNFENRAKPYIRRIKDILRSGRLGSPMMMRLYITGLEVDGRVRIDMRG